MSKRSRGESCRSQKNINANTNSRNVAIKTQVNHDVDAKVKHVRTQERVNHWKEVAMEYGRHKHELVNAPSTLDVDTSRKRAPQTRTRQRTQHT